MPHLTTSHAATSATSDLPSPGLLDRLTALENELATVRRSARRLRIGLGLVAAGIVGTLLAAAAAPDAFDVIRARRLEIVDTHNKVVGVLTAGNEGGQLDLWNAGGANSARLGATARGGDLSLWGANGNAAIGTYATDGGGRLEFYDGGGLVQGRLTATRDGGTLALLSSLSKPGVIATATDHGGAISACDALGRPLAEMAIADGAGSVRLADKTTHLIASLHGTPRGGAIELADSEGKNAFTAGADIGGGSLAVLSTKGSPVLTAGATPEGGGSLEVRNPAGKAVVRAFSGDDDTGRWVLAAADGSPSVGAQAAASGGIFAILLSNRRVITLEANQGGGRLELTDSAGQASTAIGVDTDSHCGVVSLRNERGQELVRATADEKGSGSIAVYNRDGKDRKAFSAK